MKEKIKSWYKKTRNKLKKIKNKIKEKVTSSPAYVKFIRIRDKVAKCILDNLLAFFSYISPVLIFLCIKKEDFDGPNDVRNELRLT